MRHQRSARRIAIAARPRSHAKVLRLAPAPIHRPLGGPTLMRHWTLLGEAPLPGSQPGSGAGGDRRPGRKAAPAGGLGEDRERDRRPVRTAGRMLRLYRGKDDYAIKLSGGHELMNTRQHGSEDALGRLPCQRVAERPGARVLIGGLGMGFTLAAALAELRADAEVIVAELIPAVVDWNRGELGERSGRPLDDPRTHVHVGDVAKLIRRSPGGFDAIALDVDNGPEGLTQDENDWLYGPDGLAAVWAALRPGGVAAWWSAGPDPAFEARLRKNGFCVASHRVHAHGQRGPRHLIWLGSV